MKHLMLAALLVVVGGEAQAGTIRGRVVSDPGGAGLADRYVYALEEIAPGAYSGGHGTFSDTAGNYAISNLTAGTYVVGFEDYSGEYAKQWYPDAPAHSLGMHLYVGDAEIQSGIDMVVPLAAHVRGTVTGGGGALEGMQVEVDGEYPNQQGGTDSFGGVAYALTDENGDYDAGGLPAGRYTVKFSDPTDAYAFAYWMDTYSRNELTPLDLSASEIANNVDAALVPAGSLSGRVIPTGGGSLSQLAVYAHRADDPVGWDYLSQVDHFPDATSGAYLLAGLPPGDYVIEAVDHGSGGLSSFYGGSANIEGATVITINGGEDYTELDIVLQAGGELGGVARDTEGGIIEGLSVSLLAEGAYGWSSVQDRGTDDSGRYTFQNVTPGQYLIEYTDWTGAFAQTYYPGVYSVNAATVITVTSGLVETNLDVVLAAGGSISGHVTDTSGADLVDIIVSIERMVGDHDWDWMDSEVTDGDGNYTVAGLPPGSYRVRFADMSGGIYAPQYFDNAATSSGALTIVLTGGQSRTDIDAVMGVAGGIVGWVTDGQGAALGGIRVSAYVQEGDHWTSVRSDTTDAAGGYAITGLAPGTYVIGFVDRPAEIYARQYFQGAVSTHSATPLQVLAGGMVSNATAVLGLAGSIGGRVTDGQGAPIEDAYVDAFVRDGGSWYYVNYTYTDANGVYQIIGLPAGSFAVRVWHQDYAEEYYDNRPTIDMATVVPVGAGVAVTNINVSMAAEGQPDDGNGNGVPDGWEVTHFGSTNWCSGLSDWDQDGFPDVHEFWAGTDPTNKGSVLNIDAAQQQASAQGPVIRWPSVEGKFYRIERTAALMVPFASIWSNISASPPMNIHTDTTATGAGPWFYRIGVELP